MRESPAYIGFASSITGRLEQLPKEIFDSGGVIALR